MKVMSRIVAVVIAACLASISNNIYATSPSLSLVGDAVFDSQITLTVNIGDVSGLDGGLAGVESKLLYDASKIELNAITALQDFTLVTGSKIVLYRATGVTGGTSVLALNFTNKALANGESTTVSFSNVVISDESANEFSASDFSKTITLKSQEQIGADSPTKTNTTTNTNDLNNQNNIGDDEDDAVSEKKNEGTSQQQTEQAGIIREEYDDDIDQNNNASIGSVAVILTIVAAIAILIFVLKLFIKH